MPTASEGLTVCVATDEFHPMGGTERQVVELAVELRRRAIPVTVLSRWPLPADNPYVREIQESGITLLAPGWTGAVGGRLRRLPYVWARLRAGGADGASVEARLWRWQAARLRAMRSDGFVLHEVPFFGVLSTAGRRTLHDLAVPLVHTILGRMEGVIPVVDVPGAVVTTDGDPALEATGMPVRWIPSMGPRILANDSPDPCRPRTGILTFGGRLVPEKGVDVLLRAAARLPGTQVVVAGYGPERANLESLATQLDVAASFTGPLEQHALHALLARTDVAVFPSLRGEGLPSFVVEALALGVPVVASDIGGLRNALGRGGGSLVRPGDPDTLAGAVRRILDGDVPSHRRRARQRFEQRFAPTRVVDDYVDCYVEAMQASSSLPASTSKRRGRS